MSEIRENPAVIFRSSGGIRKLNELKSILAEVWLIKPAAGTGPLRAASTEALPQKKHTAPNVPVRGAKSGLGKRPNGTKNGRMCNRTKCQSSARFYRKPRIAQEKQR